MNKLYVRDLIDKCHAKLVIGSLDIELNNFSKDTRTLQEGDIYVGIKGENFDGNSLYKEALDKGAVGCILDNDIVLDEEYLNTFNNIFIVIVNDTIKCLQDLASFKRSLYDIPVVGVTGSVGKTSTKDIIASVMGKKFNVLKTAGNYNNHIGLPLTILSLKDHDALVIEMGMNNLGEISLLSKIARPTISVITNVGTAHIGNLGSRENILKAKLEILDGMDDKVLVINNDNDLLHDYYLNNRDNLKFITYGIDNESDYMASDIKADTLSSEFKVDGNLIKINIPGAHFILNGLCAYAIGKYFDISGYDIKKGILDFVLTKNRMEIETINGYTIINDAYNANLDSMKSAINYLGSIKTQRKVAILGDMLELGEYSEALHREVGKCVFDNNIDILITIGKCANYIKDEAIKLGFNKNNIYSYNSNEEANRELDSIIKDGDIILLKASYGMHLNEVYNKLKEVIQN